VAARPRKAPVQSGLEAGADAFGGARPQKRQKRSGSSGLQEKQARERIDDSLRIEAPPGPVDEAQPMDAEVSEPLISKTTCLMEDPLPGRRRRKLALHRPGSLNPCCQAENTQRSADFVLPIIQDGGFRMRTRGLAGHLYKITMSNFMCHEHFTVSRSSNACESIACSRSSRRGRRSLTGSSQKLLCFVSADGVWPARDLHIRFAHISMVHYMNEASG
jgi:hypothetical protein